MGGASSGQAVLPACLRHRALPTHTGIDLSHLMAAARRLLRPSRYRLAYNIKLLGSLDGVFPRTCPCCGYTGRFEAAGMPPRFDAACANCDSLERHRLLILMMEREKLICDVKDVVHFAPEESVRRYLASSVSNYMSCDLSGIDVDQKENLEAMSFADGSFDLVVVSSVLQYVDDKRALSEIYRVLRPNGRAILMVPTIEGWERTYENPEVTTENQRELHFGQSDHVRFYGRDFRNRIRGAGFELTEYTSEGRDVIDFGLLRGEKVFVASKVHH